MLLRFLLGLFIGILLAELSKLDAMPLILVIVAYFVGVLHKNILIKLENKNAKK